MKHCECGEIRPICTSFERFTAAPTYGWCKACGHHTDCHSAESAYPSWTQTYSGEDFDRTQDLARELTERDRAAKVPSAPAYGYSAERFDEASKIVKSAKR